MCVSVNLFCIRYNFSCMMKFIHSIKANFKLGLLVCVHYNGEFIVIATLDRLKNIIHCTEDIVITGFHRIQL